MLLKRIYANKKTFKTITFNETGLNFIAAKQQDQNKDTSGKTYNGVGKSLLVSIIHFCLGADSNHYSSFCAQLPTWEFYLDFSINGNAFTSKRTTENPNRILLNDIEYTLENFKTQLSDLCFDIPAGVNTLSFRALLKFFIRPNNDWYVDVMGKHHSDYQKLLYNAFLLGLDVLLIQQKSILKKERDRIKLLENNFKVDDFLRDYSSGSKDVSLAIVDLKDQIEKLEGDLREFRVADDYQDVQRKADQIEKELFNINNSIILKQNNLDSINDSLQIHTGTDQSDIQKIYEEVNIHFPEQLLKTLSDLESFYEKLILNRESRLLNQKNRIEQEIYTLAKHVNSLKDELDRLMKYLGEHQALDVFVAVNNELAHYKSELERLLNYQTMLSDYKVRLREIDTDMIQQSEITESYLREFEPKLTIIRDYFRTLSKRFYSNSNAGITVSNNDGLNQQRFNISAKIESDDSDGINRVKIFCYDMTILFKGQNHNIDFVFHDSRLFDGIDERQLAVMFKILSEIFAESGKQYIATINQNHLAELASNMDKEMFDEIITRNTVLTLTDESDSGKLLGITTAINYN